MLIPEGALGCVTLDMSCMLFDYLISIQTYCTLSVRPFRADYPNAHRITESRNWSHILAEPCCEASSIIQFKYTVNKERL